MLRLAEKDGLQILMSHTSQTCGFSDKPQVLCGKCILGVAPPLKSRIAWARVAPRKTMKNIMTSMLSHSAFSSSH